MASESNKKLNNLLIDKISNFGFEGAHCTGPVSGELYHKYGLYFLVKKQGGWISFENNLLSDFSDCLKEKSCSLSKLITGDDIITPFYVKKWPFIFENKEAFFVETYGDPDFYYDTVFGEQISLPVYIYFNQTHPKKDDIEKFVLAYFDKYEDGKNENN